MKPRLHRFLRLRTNFLTDLTDFFKIISIIHQNPGNLFLIVLEHIDLAASSCFYNTNWARQVKFVLTWRYAYSIV